MPLPCRVSWSCVLVLLAACEDDAAPVHDGSMRVEDGSMPTHDGSMSTRDGGVPLDAVDAGALGCLEADRLFVGRVYSDPVIGALRACTLDSDCVALPTGLRCPAPGSSTIEYCATPIASTAFDAGVAWLRAQETELCPQIMPGCISVSDCAAPRLHRSRLQPAAKQPRRRRWSPLTSRSLHVCV